MKATVTVTTPGPTNYPPVDTSPAIIIAACIAVSGVAVTGFITWALGRRSVRVAQQSANAAARSSTAAETSAAAAAQSAQAAALTADANQRQAAVAEKDAELAARAHAESVNSGTREAQVSLIQRLLSPPVPPGQSAIVEDAFSYTEQVNAWKELTYDAFGKSWGTSDDAAMERLVNLRHELGHHIEWRHAEHLLIPDVDSQRSRFRDANGAVDVSLRTAGGYRILEDDGTPAPGYEIMRVVREMLRS